jgi:hypothetical protein
MSVTVAATSAVGAAALFALATAVQTKALGDVERRITGNPDGSGKAAPLLGLRVVTSALSSRAWLGGGAIAVVAFGLHALALHEGNLTLVQPLLITMVLFALPASRAVGGQRITRPELGWGIVLVLGLAGLFAAADPASHAGTGIDLWPAVAATGIALFAIGLCVGLARGRAGSTAAALLGAGAGIAFAGTAALIKTATNLLAHGALNLVTAWQLYVLIVVGATGIVLSQLAYRAGPLSASLPAMNSVNPLASILIGAAVFDEHFRSGPIPSTVEALALAVMTLATVLLSRLSREQTGASRATPRGGQADSGRRVS